MKERDFDLVKQRIMDEVDKYGDYLTSSSFDEEKAIIMISSGSLECRWELYDMEIKSKVYLESEESKLNLLSEEVDRLKNYSWIISNIHKRIIANQNTL